MKTTKTHKKWWLLICHDNFDVNYQIIITYVFIWIFSQDEHIAKQKYQWDLYFIAVDFS